MATLDNKYEGIWKGQLVKFKRTWSGHDFTDEECRKLCNGEEIEIEAVSLKTGKVFSCTGKLDAQSYNGRVYVGFQPTNPVQLSTQIKILISYENFDEYQCDILIALPCAKANINNDTIIDIAVGKWMERHMPNAYQYSWQRASECGMEDYPTDVFFE